LRHLPEVLPLREMILNGVKKSEAATIIEEQLLEGCEKADRFKERDRRVR